MQYVTVGESGKDYQVKMQHGPHYMRMVITSPPGCGIIYENQFLPYPKLNNPNESYKRLRILAEENGERIARNYIK